MIGGMKLILFLLAAAGAALQPADFLHEEKGGQLDFSYAWPAAVDALPTLRERLRGEMEADRRQALEWANEARDEARREGREFFPHYYDKGWQVAGSTPLLLSLTASKEAFTGGAHGNIHFSSILWDLRTDQAATAAEVLGTAALESMAGRYCASLNAEQAERRHEPVQPDPDDQFSQCPPLAEQVLAPKDTDGNSRFDTLDVLLAPYVAGPYAEGPYFVEMPFRANDVAILPERWRAAFEPARSPTGAAGDADCPLGDMDLPRGPGAVCIGRLTESYAFAVAWPAEAARIPALAALLRQEAERSEQWLRQEAEVATGERSEGRDQPLRFSYAQGWSVDANVPELVAASGSAQSYTGGAHGGLAYDAILLDSRRGERIRLGDLFADRAAGLAAVQASLCPALAAEVERRRGGSQEEYECPPAADHPVTLICGAGPRIDLMLALLNPYVIGSWSEGPYDVAFPVTPRMLAALKPEYRPAFAAARAVPAGPPTTSRCSRGSAAG
jgi:hypothetical protein